MLELYGVSELARQLLQSPAFCHAYAAVLGFLKLSLEDLLFFFLSLGPKIKPAIYFVHESCVFHASVRMTFSIENTAYRF